MLDKPNYINFKSTLGNIKVTPLAQHIKYVSPKRSANNNSKPTDSIKKAHFLIFSVLLLFIISFFFY